MSIPANVTSTGVFQAADWTPPPIEKLDFTSNCGLVKGFYSSWFRGLLQLGPSEDKYAVYNLPFSNRESSFFVANSVDANITEAYFRNALPPELRDVPSYGQVLDWEFALRTDFARSLARLSALKPPSEPTPIEWFLNTSYQAPYFTHVIRDPGITCQAQACSSFSWDQLLDINGPGVSVVYWVQVTTMIVASILVVYELWLTRLRTPQNQRHGPALSSAYHCFRHTVEALNHGTVYFFATTPLALFIEYMGKGPHFFPWSDQSTALVVSSLSLMMLFWAWRMNRCFAAIDLVKGFSPVDSKLSHLPLACLVAAVPFLSFLLNVFVQPSSIDAFNFDAFSLIICRGIEGQLKIYEETDGRVNTNDLYIITQLATSILTYAAARLLWDDLAMRLIVEQFLPWGKSREFAEALRDAVLSVTHMRPGRLDDKELDRVTHTLHLDPRISAHIWYLGYGEMVGTSTASLYTLITYNRWRNGGVEWSQAGEQWSLGQILSIFTMAPAVVGVMTSAHWSAKGLRSVDQEGRMNVPLYLRNLKRRVIAGRLITRVVEAMRRTEMGGVGDTRDLPFGALTLQTGVIVEADRGEELTIRDAAIIQHTALNRAAEAKESEPAQELAESLVHINPLEPAPPTPAPMAGPPLALALAQPPVQGHLDEVQTSLIKPTQARESLAVTRAPAVATGIAQAQDSAAEISEAQAQPTEVAPASNDGRFYGGS
ncbi:hypothetical protein B0T24DRAFT_119226 [Lasiosphaeria ovina]|uniref:Uncharacterized protein n=1 Tax=Lasiosphaeria ovina TaxID=92902 RepID=A0AAE0JSZ4_9PEZI|nr:hypothetical protein B0T24DRAFT_119226 [Lasiosphaeria ovina]